jgi:hypothetical protein
MIHEKDVAAEISQLMIDCGARLALSRSLLNGKDGNSWDRSYAAFL